ncbi:MAG: hypothetical protein KGZ80_05650 [Methylomonas sp.]|nr:hypothetical protein [Methylomonas sp.]PPD20724.1 MAG: hypothetical protein CTY23_07870 [Methylomonas sp.]PPD26221.1 MAG: hypothetical protein CTY22_05885 [Methylomonas sp.]PPD37939.1 MAG: hypothetical protein CTY21_05880 [Methylomonas sp.]PPD54625.1 MAG: hypothetical protein CTY11_03250 [Methylomonas sp.]
MPFFVIFSALIGVLTAIASPYLPWLLQPQLATVGLIIGGVFLLAGLIAAKRVPFWHDGFAIGCLLYWYPEWRPLFSDQAPIFHWYPLYFSVTGAWLSLWVVHRARYFDEPSRQSLRVLQGLARFDTRALGCIVAASLFLPDQYLLYPLVMTVFIIRFTMEACLKLFETD